MVRNPPRRPPSYTPPNQKQYIGAQAEPLSGEKTTKILEKLAPNVLKDPEGKLPESACCFCWNWDKECKILDSLGICSRLHVCMHEDCRTIYHHGHTIKQRRPSLDEVFFQKALPALLYQQVIRSRRKRPVSHTDLSTGRQKTKKILPWQVC